MKILPTFLKYTLLSFSLILFIGCSVEDLKTEPNSMITKEAKFDSRVSVPVFTTTLKGQNEVPSVETKATGTLILRVNEDSNSIHYKLIVANIHNVLASHLHVGPEIANGPVVAFLYSGGANGPVNGVLAEGTL
ncbi:MAG: CHRD domain-containing protein, partial [Flavobacteriaceae bacterium]|nr:CHRD domain-containing protein [Flavobacteriaceae bacterium]